jgi:large subunit ribosomal protein L22
VEASEAKKTKTTSKSTTAKKTTATKSTTTKKAATTTTKKTTTTAKKATEKVEKAATKKAVANEEVKEAKAATKAVKVEKAEATTNKAKRKAKKAELKEAKRLAPSATLKNARISARKVKIVIDNIRGKNVNEAIAILKFTPKAASPLVEKLLKSAIANAENNSMMDKSKLYVAEVYANQGTTMKRIRAATQGRANRIRKRTSHITIVLKERA